LNSAVGAYHVGIEVCGLEWSYGGIDDGTGVFFVSPHQATIGKYKDSVKVGETSKTVEEILDSLKDLAASWKGSEYHLLTKNCVLFSQAFLSSLCPGVTLPSYTRSTADSLQVLAPLIGETNSGAISTSVTSVTNDRMWIEAKIKMNEYAKRYNKIQATQHALPKLIHSASGIPPEHTIHETVDYVRRVRASVTMNYSRYAKSLLRYFILCY